MKSTCISCMILIMALFLYLFLDLSAENKNEDVQFGTISYLATRSTSCRQVFEIHFGCGENIFKIDGKKESMVKFPVKIQQKPEIYSHLHEHTNNRDTAT